MTLPQDIPPDLGKLQSAMNAAVKTHWKAFLFEGIVLALLGLAAMIVPPLASLAVTIFLGWMFLLSGIVGLFATYWARQMPGFWWSLFSAALAVLAGGLLLARPAQGILTLTIVVGAYFLAEGVVTIMYALEHRRDTDRGENALAAQVHALGTDRSKLASDLDAASARARTLESANREIAQRLDTAMENIRAVLEARQ